ncbi:hypothetical protein H4R26_002415 [Coemansia thaxteri]|uniref:Enoyl reductase (ER) domain-containing protein n=1 Tax=Coemansia thaxteri TaxID=2663907 RepID=A0A9W8EFM9_9FUNG|nr:hypothetical protein H4R26_002415 [Coemansia thaxteri]
MSPSTITRVALSSYVPAGNAKLSDFAVEQVPAPTKDQLKEGQVIVKPLYFSVDPYQRGRLSGATDSYVASYVKGQPITNFLVGAIAESSSKDFKQGDLVLASNGSWETEYITDASAISKAPVQQRVDPKDYVGVLSMPSFTAYVGAAVLAKPKAGETILVSSASGAVGQMVVQLAKARGLRVVGVAGSDEKVEYVKSLGADAAFNYKTCGDFTKAIRGAAPEGIDIYFDNVGGEFLDAALANINTHARIIICGAISQYNASSPDELYGVKNLTKVLVKKATIQGFIITDYYSTPHFGEFTKEVSSLYHEGKIKYRLSETQGLENGPQAILDLFAGKNFGKSIIKA